MSPKNYATSLKVVVATWNRHGMHSHAGAWERGKKHGMHFHAGAWERGNRHRLHLVPTLPRGNAYLRDEHFITSSFREITELWRPP